MRVITGKARGVRLNGFEGQDIRPTTDRVKEAIFSAIQFDIRGRNVLDMFSGTGQLGIEALSRGAAHCTFVDNDKNSLKLIKSNLEKVKFEKNTYSVIEGDSFGFVERTDRTFDIVLADPPYRMGLIEKTMLAVRDRLSENALVVCEHEREAEFEFGDFELLKRHNYGKISVSIFRRK